MFIRLASGSDTYLTNSKKILGCISSGLNLFGSSLFICLCTISVVIVSSMITLLVNCWNFGRAPSGSLVNTLQNCFQSIFALSWSSCLSDALLLSDSNNGATPPTELSLLRTCDQKTLELSFNLLQMFFDGSSQLVSSFDLLRPLSKSFKRQLHSFQILPQNSHD